MTSTTNVSVASEVYDEVVQWIYAEAELLDAWKEREWLEEMVSKDIVYQVPLRQTIERARGNGFAQGAFHFDERFGSLETRVARNETEYAWAEDPPSRIRHHISNIRVAAGDQGFQVSSNLLIFRTHRDAIKPELLSARRFINAHSQTVLLLKMRPKVPQFKIGDLRIQEVIETAHNDQVIATGYPENLRMLYKAVPDAMQKIGPGSAVVSLRSLMVQADGR